MPEPCRLIHKTDERITFEGDHDTKTMVTLQVVVGRHGVVITTMDYRMRQHFTPPLSFEQADVLIDFLKQKIAEERLRAEQPGELVFVADTIGVS